MIHEIPQRPIPCANNTLGAAISKKVTGEIKLRRQKEIQPYSSSDQSPIDCQSPERVLKI